MSIQLRTKGNGELAENALGTTLCVCPRCGGDNNELVFTGTRRSVIICSNCKTHNYGGRASETCGRCGESLRGGESRKMEEYEKIPTSLCNTCEKEEDEHRAIVKSGGVYFKCEACGRGGAVKKSPYTEHIREYMTAQKPEPGKVAPNYSFPYDEGRNYLLLGVKFSKCEEHGG